MGPELRKVADTIMSDLGMGEDQDKIDALEQGNDVPRMRLCIGMISCVWLVSIDFFMFSRTLVCTRHHHG